MPVILIADIDDRGTYDAVASRLDLAGDRPAGLILHAASETAGGVRIVDVWESAEQAETFERGRLFPAFEAAGVMDKAGPETRPVAHEPFDFIA
jgi:hypothetical protein